MGDISKHCRKRLQIKTNPFRQTIIRIDVVIIVHYSAAKSWGLEQSVKLLVIAMYLFIKGKGSGAVLWDRTAEIS